MEQVNIIICGVGGQGNILLERIIGIAAMRAGLTVRASDTFGAAQRGGSVQSQIRIGNCVYGSLIPEGSCHVIIGLEPGEALHTASRNLAPDGIVMVNTSPVLPAGAKTGKSKYPPVADIVAQIEKVARKVVAMDATVIARAITGSSQYLNTVMLGGFAALALLPVDPQTYQTAIQETTGTLADTNLNTFAAGFKEASKILQSIRGTG